MARMLVVVAILACGGNGETDTGSQAGVSTATTDGAEATTTAASETTQASPTGPTLTIEGRAFGQAPDVAAGETLTIVNLDSTRHTFTSADESWDAVAISANSEVPFTVPDSLAPGSYVFFCTIHSDMGGSLNVSG